MSDGWYDTAQICINGHTVNLMSVSRPEHNRKFCDRCGAPTITKCQNCNVSINGFYHEGTADEFDIEGMIEEIVNPPPNITHDYTTVQSFCHDCGKPYPWTEAILKAAKELSEELDNLSPEERNLLKKSIDDIVRETPQTTVAVSRFKRLVAKAEPVAVDMYREILLPLLNESVKKQIWPS